MGRERILLPGEKKTKKDLSRDTRNQLFIAGMLVAGFSTILILILGMMGIIDALK